MTPFASSAIKAVFDAYPAEIRCRLMDLRELIFSVAASTEGVDALEETLKWGEPAYVTKNKSGSTVRIDWKKAAPDQYSMYFHCQTNLVETFRRLFPEDFTFVGNREIVFHKEDPVAVDALAICIAASLTYHLDGKRPGTPGRRPPKQNLCKRG